MFLEGNPMKKLCKIFVVLPLTLLQCCEVFTITCKDVLAAGSGVVLDLQELSSLKLLSNNELENCLVYLGKEKLQPKQAQVIWLSVRQVYGSIEEIPERSLQDLGWIMLGIAPTHFHNMSFTEPDTISAFGKYRGLSLEQLGAVRESIFTQWSSKSLEDLTSYDLAALGHIICSFNTTEVSRIHPDSYRDAAIELCSLQDCPLDITSQLANLAISSDAFGDPRLWTSTQVSAVGCVMAGLPTLSIIPAEAMEGLTLHTISCLSNKVLQRMTEAQLSKFPPAVGLSLTVIQKSLLSKGQMFSLTSAIEENQFNNMICSVPSDLIVFIFIFLLLY